MPFLILHMRIRSNSSLSLRIHFSVNKTTHNQQSLIHGLLLIRKYSMNRAFPLAFMAESNHSALLRIAITCSNVPRRISRGQNCVRAGCGDSRWALSVFIDEWKLLLPPLGWFHHPVLVSPAIKSLKNGYKQTLHSAKVNSNQLKTSNASVEGKLQSQTTLRGNCYMSKVMQS